MSETIANSPLLEARRLQYTAWSLATNLLVNHGGMVLSSGGPNASHPYNGAYWSTGYMLRGTRPTVTSDSASYKVARVDVRHDNDQEDLSELSRRTQGFYEDVLTARESPFSWRRRNARARLETDTKRLSNIELSLGVATVGALNEGDAVVSTLYTELHMPRRKADAAYCDSTSRKRNRNGYLSGQLDSDPDVMCGLSADRVFSHNGRSSNRIQLYPLPADTEKAFLGLGGENGVTVDEYEHYPDEIRQYVGPMSLAVATLRDVHHTNRPLKTLPDFSTK